MIYPDVLTGLSCALEYSISVKFLKFFLKPVMVKLSCSQPPIARTAV